MFSQTFTPCLSITADRETGWGSLCLGFRRKRVSAGLVRGGTRLWKSGGGSPRGAQISESKDLNKAPARRAAGRGQVLVHPSSPSPDQRGQKYTAFIQSAFWLFLPSVAANLNGAKACSWRLTGMTVLYHLYQLQCYLSMLTCRMHFFVYLFGLKSILLNSQTSRGMFALSER